MDAVFAHMLLCMALRQGLADVVHRGGHPLIDTLTAGGRLELLRIFEHGGFAVHFFDRALVDSLADDWTLDESTPSRKAGRPAIWGASPEPAARRRLPYPRRTSPSTERACFS